VLEFDIQGDIGSILEFDIVDYLTRLVDRIDVRSVYMTVYKGGYTKGGYTKNGKWVLYKTIQKLVPDEDTLMLTGCL
jgi:hypothetical protein